MSVWDELEKLLMDQYCLPHNLAQLSVKGKTPKDAAQAKLAEIKSGLSTITREDFVGPRLFMRVVGPANRVYSGEWWFDASLLDKLEATFSRIYFVSQDKKAVLRNSLREALAISREWNLITEVWVLELPAGEHITGFSGPGNPQKLFAKQPPSAPENRMLLGQAPQVFFPVKNPLWIKHYENLQS